MLFKLDINNQFKPTVFRLGNEEGVQLFSELTKQSSGNIVLDLFEGQKKELFKIRSPRKPLTAEELNTSYQQWITGRQAAEEGVWVHYPWLNKLLHIVDEVDFFELRTSRNNYKITPSEQKQLAAKTVGIIGLSVGHAVAVNIATERICGKMRLADFDTLELSNLNRIKTALHNIGLNKCIITAREIAEIDPFIDIECFTDGITADNIDSFLLDGGAVDILIDECDSIDIKILARQRAQQLGIPVVMETSDRGMLDVERFDKEPGRPIFHGFLEGLPAEMLTNITPANRIPLTLRIVNAPNGSARGKASMLEIGQTISTWPQLASSVTLGGAVVTDTCRRILLDSYTESGRYYVDIDGIVANKEPKASNLSINPFQPFNFEEGVKLVDGLGGPAGTSSLTETQLEQIVQAACQAPSTGNDQPWKWIYKNNTLFLFHDRYRSFSFGNFHDVATYISLGAACENLHLQAATLGFKVNYLLFPLAGNTELVASFYFYEDSDAAANLFKPTLVNQIYSRNTNRNPSQAAILPASNYEALTKAAETVAGARVQFVTDKPTIMALGNLIGQCDRIRLLNPEGHRDFVAREMRWSKQHADATRDGIDIQTLGLPPALQVALAMVKDVEVAESLKKIPNGANALVEAAMLTTSTASALGVLTLPEYKAESFFNGGIAMQRLWLEAEALGLALHPLISPFYLFPRITKSNAEGLDEAETAKLTGIRKQFLQILPLEDNLAEVFLFKIAHAPKPAVASLRLPLSDSLYYER